MQSLQNWKNTWQKMPGRTKKAIGVLVGGTLVLALAAILVLNLGKDRSYATLFSGLSQEEAQEVANLLQDEGVDYRFDTGNGSIRVPQGSADQLRADLLSQGYPKSGFTYDMYLDNAGLMTTESDKEQVTLYELQDRLGAQIRLFDGVQDAKVTIAKGTESRYALSDEPQVSASASVVITMENGATLTADKANAVKNLISRAVRGMEFTNVAVFDASTMMEVGAENSAESASGNAESLTNLTSMVENSIAGNVRRVLEQIYGQGNVAVSVKGTLNMERVVQENTQYTTPDKIDEQDKTGLLQREDTANENSSAGGQGAGGVAGTDANADTPRYTNEAGTGQEGEVYTNGSASREWLYNMMREQRMVDPGVLENTTVGVVITTNDTDSVTETDLMNLVANSAGIPIDQAEQKVSVVRAPLPAEMVSVPADQTGASSDFSLPIPVLAALAAAGLLAILLLALLLLQGRRHKAELQAAREEAEAFAQEAAASEADLPENGADEKEAEAPVDVEDEEQKKNEEILNLRMQHSLRLKKNIGDFVDQNPQIAAKLIQGWLQGEE